MFPLGIPAPPAPIWASEDERLAHFRATTYVPCPVCSSPGGQCYRICPNSPHFYSAEQEREDTLWQESLSDGEYMSLAVAQYEREHGPGSYCS